MSAQRTRILGDGSIEMPEKPISCACCGASHELTAGILRLCPECARSGRGLSRALAAHERARNRFALPGSPPSTEGGYPCVQCGAGCLIGEGERGFCGLRTVREGKLRHLAGTRKRGILHWYRDPLPTNCVAYWVCEGGRHRGRHNLAVFYASCTLDCLFCQNWHFREVDIERSGTLSADGLADKANRDTFCVCFFGGDPASQMPHAITAGKLLADRGVKVCWETAGTANVKMMDRAVQLSLDSGGIVKFDLKAFTDPLHVALTGIGNRQTLDNFSRAAERIPEKSNGPLVVASTLLVPGYVDAAEVGRVASFIARHDREIPYSLLAFGPGYLMADLPRTSRQHAEDALGAALDAGLTNVHIGNRHLIESATT